MSGVVSSVDEVIDELVETLQVPVSKYEDANRAFKSICDWFDRDGSSIRGTHQESYLQGSFRLGTAIRPTTEEDDYDVDIATILNESKNHISQRDLKAKLGIEIKSYSTRYGMKRPVDARRCWTQAYADDSQFHVDVLPAISDVDGQRLKLEARDMSLDWLENAIAITDKKSQNYSSINPDWLISNPKSYALWFEAQMTKTLDLRKSAIALNEGKSVDDIPTYRARTPLQKSIQILKYHRDVMFAEDPDDRPISIIITTLSAQAYNQETSTADALEVILSNMDQYIEQEHGVDWVRNPTNPLENFADKWIEYPARRTNFFEWLQTARKDFVSLRAAADEASRNEVITEAFGDEVQKRYSDRRSGNSTLNFLARRKKTALPAAHKQSPPWEVGSAGTVRIFKAVKNERGFRVKPFSSDGIPIRKHAKIRFFAKTDVPGPFEVYWQAVNTGEEAMAANCPRGGFDTGSVFSGHMQRSEDTLYSGTHSIECFIVKDGYLRARSGQFIVNIQ